ncbi:hypothetical protein LDENG_00135850 [Lucifuga dentata]|nr:hypothetical protein LDENG_00135850 [Lucifuga dentata]
MLSVLLSTFTCVCILTAPPSAWADMQTVVGVAGSTVMLPCYSEAANQRGVEVCWGRSQPTLFSCHDTLIHTPGPPTTSRTSHRYSLSSSASGTDVSLFIANARPSDSGFYHCRIQLPGFFNDQTFIIHLIVITNPPPVVISIPTAGSTEGRGAETLNAPQTDTSDSRRGVATERGSDVTGGYTMGPVVAQVKFPEQQLISLKMFTTNTLRATFIIFIPALLLTAAYRVWSSKQKPGNLKSSEEEEEEEEEESSV